MPNGPDFPGQTVLRETSPHKGKAGSTAVQEGKRSVGQPTELRTDTRKPKILEPGIALFVWLDVPPDYTGWPALTVGEDEPALDVSLETPWIEDAAGNVLNVEEIEKEAKAKFDELFKNPLTEQTAQVSLGGVHEIVPNRNAKEIQINVAEGGDFVETVVSGSALGVDPSAGPTRGGTIVIFKTS